MRVIGEVVNEGMGEMTLWRVMEEVVGEGN